MLYGLDNFAVCCGVLLLCLLIANLLWTLCRRK